MSVPCVQGWESHHNLSAVPPPSTRPLPSSISQSLSLNPESGTLHTCFTPKFPFSPSQKLPSLLLCFLHLSCNISFPPASSTVLSSFATSYLPTVKAVPRLLKSLLPGGREDGGGIGGGSSPTAVTQQVRRVWIRARGLLTVLKGLSILFVSLWHLNIPSPQ